jgi:hypothetical protein
VHSNSQGNMQNPHMPHNNVNSGGMSGFHQGNIMNPG